MWKYISIWWVANNNSEKLRNQYILKTISSDIYQYAMFGFALMKKYFIIGR
jgi:hypothetical protein